MTADPVLTAAGDYLVTVLRDVDSLEFDTYKLPALYGCEETVQKCGKITAQVAKHSNIMDRQSIVRMDVPYISAQVDGRRSRVLFVKVA